MSKRGKTGGTTVSAILLATALILCGATQGAASYTVRKGDTLWEIAQRYHTSVSALAKANGLSEKSTLSIGKKLTIPGEQARIKKAAAARATGKCIATAYTCKENVVLRSGPSTRQSKVATLKADTSVRVIGTSGSWRKVELSSGLKGFIYRPLLTTVPRSARSGETSGNDALVRTALAYRGARYHRGGASRSGFDCSGFTRYVFAKYGVVLPHSSAAQARLGTSVPKDQLKAGDLVFFHTYRRGISHVGIYIGDNKFIHASTRRTGVRVDSLSHPYYEPRYRGARRVK